jgi:hypothetical protein
VQEELYDIEIKKDGNNYKGKIYSNEFGIKEFSNNKIESLLRDITYDIRLALGDISNKDDE